MRFIVNAQLPRHPVSWLMNAGQDAIHTLDLPRQNRSTDSEIIEVAEQQDRVVVTKDADFVDSYLLQKRPHKLVLISTGNLTNKQLESLVTPLIPDLSHELQTSSFLEITMSGIQIRG